MLTYIQLLSPVFHNLVEYPAGTILAISENLNEHDAERLIQLGAAQYYDQIAITENQRVLKNTDDSNGITPVTEMTKSQCQTELTAAGVVFKKTDNLATLQQLVNEHRESLKKHGANGNDDDDDDDDNDDDDDGIDISSLSREQLELELTARTIPFNSEQSDDELRQLLINYESDDDNE